MNKKLITVKNPLTAVAIFAGIAEGAGAAVLPLLAETNQTTYMWFLMIFPVFLVLLFFATLNFNRRVFYAPSDFDDEKNFMELFRSSTTPERLQKLEEKMSEEEANSSFPSSDVKAEEIQDTPKQEVITSRARVTSRMQQDLRSRYLLAESLIIDRLATEFRTIPRREIALRNRYGDQLFDAVFETQKGLVLAEITVFAERTYPHKIRTILQRVQETFFTLPEEIREDSRFLLAIAYEMPKTQANRIRRELNSMLKNFNMPAEIRMYDLQELINSI